MLRFGLFVAILSLTVVLGLAQDAEVKLDESSSEQDDDDDDDDDEVQSPSLETINNEDYAEYPVRSLKEIDIDMLQDKCVKGECHNLIYDDPSEVVFFESKPGIRFTSKRTYSFKKPQEYEILKFIDSKFANFPLNLFYSLKIQELDIRNCSIQSLSWDNFLMADRLSILLLSDNDIVEIKPMTFNSAENLAFLFLDGNDIDTLFPDSFKKLSKLFMLDLHNNRLSTLPDEIFSHLPSLHQVNLAGNRLRVISDVIFLNNLRLSSVNLDYNRIEKLGDYTFQNQQAMDYIGLSHNSPLENLVGNMRVDNLWVRNCSISRVNIYGKAKNVDLQKNRITELYFSQPESLETLRLSDNALTQIASLSQATNLQIFDVSNNPKLQTFPEYWQADSLEVLDLSNTSLTAIPITIMEASERLQSLNVSNNRLTHIDPGHFKYFEKLNHFYIHRNNWNCYSLQLIMDILIKPWKISYTWDEYDDNFPGEYIGGIKCMFRLEEDEEEDDDDADQVNDLENIINDPLSLNDLTSRLTQALNSNDEMSDSSQLQREDTPSAEQSANLDILRSEFKAIVGIYEQKFLYMANRIDDLDRRLKAFEQYNQTMWQHVTITI